MIVIKASTAATISLERMALYPFMVWRIVLGVRLDNKQLGLQMARFT
jgi:hypothetical protein